MDTTIVVTDTMLDTIIKTNARDMYRAEYWAMAMELKSARAALNQKREDIHFGAGMMLDDAMAAGWARGLRSKMGSMKIGEKFVIPDIARLMRYVITAEDW